MSINGFTMGIMELQCVLMDLIVGIHGFVNGFIMGISKDLQFTHVYKIHKLRTPGNYGQNIIEVASWKHNFGHHFGDCYKGIFNGFITTRWAFPICWFINHID